MSLDQYRPLGRSGLIVSPLSLGTMTFGAPRWGIGRPDAETILDAYVDAGGNVIDTADIYAGGEGETMIGEMLAARRNRHHLVLATKSGFATGRGPWAGGNGAGAIKSALEGSLQRLRTDYIDLYWVHVWDGITPADELLETMAGLVRAGKVRYWGISNTPAWYVAQVATLARTRGLPGPIALQYFYSLVSRNIEAEHVPLARDAGLGLVPWSPLAYGLLTGKYDRAAVEARAPHSGGAPNDAQTSRSPRLDGPNPFGDSLFTARNWSIVDAVKAIAAETGRSAAQVALAWVLARPGVDTTLIGVSRVGQLSDNLGALDLSLSSEHRTRLEAVSRPDLPMLYALFSDEMRRHVVFGGAAVLKH